MGIAIARFSYNNLFVFNAFFIDMRKMSFDIMLFSDAAIKPVEVPTFSFFVYSKVLKLYSAAIL
jgi:hypothetical protein